jgi:predicted MFS family arabinose efflux permease
VVLTVVPEKKLPENGDTLRQQIAGYGRIFSSLAFWRITAALVICLGTYQALQGLWLAPWLYDVAGLERGAVARYLLLSVAAYTAGSLFFGMASDRLAGVSRMMLFKVGLTLSLAMLVLLAAWDRIFPPGTTHGLGAVLMLYGFTTIAVSLAYPLFTSLFGPEMTGRVNTASNVLMFGCAFAAQWGIGAVLRLYPIADNGYSRQGYAAALSLLAALQLAALLWLLPMKEPRRSYARL